MKLLIFCYEYPPIGGGAGNALAHLSRAWAAQGNAVTIVTSGFGDLSPDQTSHGVRIVRFPVGRRSVSRGTLVEMARYMFASRAACESIYNETRPDLAVAFMTLPSGVGPMLLKRRHNLPFVTELRGGDVPGFLPNLLGFFHGLTRGWIRSIWDASALVIANSDGLAELAKKTAPHIPFKVVPNGVDTRVFRPSDAPHADPASCRCVFVGRLVDGQKQISKLIEVAGRQPGLELVIVGAGPDEARLRGMAAAGSASDRIRFTGWIKGPDLIHTLQSSDVYVSASVGEGMSNSALEALSCGLPMVLSRISGHEELVVDGQNGFLFDAGSTRELEDRLMQLASDPDRRIRFGQASRQHAVRHFDWSALAGQHLDLYRQALSS